MPVRKVLLILTIVMLRWKRVDHRRPRVRRGCRAPEGSPNGKQCHESQSHPSSTNGLFDVVFAVDDSVVGSESATFARCGSSNSSGRASNAWKEPVSRCGATCRGSDFDRACPTGFQPTGCGNLGADGERATDLAGRFLGGCRAPLRSGLRLRRSARGSDGWGNDRIGA